MKKAGLVLWAMLSGALAAQSVPPPSGGKLTLFQVQQEVLQQSPSLREGESKVREAGYKTDEVFTQVVPTLSIQAGGNRITPPVASNFAGNIINITPEYNYNAALILRQTLLTFGRLHWAAAASELNEKATQADLQDRRLRVMEEATLAYYETLLTQAQVGIAQDQLKASQARLQEARNLVKAGSAAPFDVKRNEASQAQSEQQVLEAQNRAGLTRIRLYTMLQRPDLGEQLEPVTRLPLPPHDNLDQALARRYDLAASRWGAEAAQARVKLAEAQNNPNLGLQTDYATRNQTGFSSGTQWTVGLNLQIPLYDGGLSEARANQDREVVEQLLALYDQANRNAHTELNSLVLDLSNRYQRLAVTQRTVDSAMEAARIARLRYQNGLSTNVELLDSESALTTAQRDQVTAHYLYLGTLARYQRASAQEVGPPCPR